MCWIAIQIPMLYLISIHKSGMEAYLVRGEGRSEAERRGPHDGAPTPTTNEERTPNVGQTKGPPKRRGSAVVEYFTYMEGTERSYINICEENRPKNPKNIIMRQEDGSTNSFWRHLKAKHREQHSRLRGESDGQTRITDTLGEAEGASSCCRRRPFTGRTEEETKNHITRYVCATDIPFRTVDHIRFKEMWQYNAQLEVDTPSSKTIRQWTGGHVSDYERRSKTIISKCATSSANYRCVDCR